MITSTVIGVIVSITIAINIVATGLRYISYKPESVNIDTTRLCVSRLNSRLWSKVVDAENTWAYQHEAFQKIRDLNDYQKALGYGKIEVFNLLTIIHMTQYGNNYLTDRGLRCKDIAHTTRIVYEDDQEEINVPILGVQMEGDRTNITIGLSSKPPPGVTVTEHRHQSCYKRAMRLCSAKIHPDSCLQKQHAILLMEDSRYAQELVCKPAVALVDICMYTPWGIYSATHERCDPDRDITIIEPQIINITYTMPDGWIDDDGGMQRTAETVATITSLLINAYIYITYISLLGDGLIKLNSKTRLI